MRPLQLLTRVLAFLSLVSIALPPERSVAQNGYGWRGDGTGRFPDANPVLHWSPTEHIVWKTDLPGTSPASPVLVGDRVFVTSDPFLLLCLSAQDGSVLWQKSHSTDDLPPSIGIPAGADQPSHNPDGHAGSAAATPVSDGSSIYATFSNGVAAAYSLDGALRWQRFVELPKTGFGHAGSPLLAGGQLIVHFTDVVALDASTGSPRWRLQRPATHASPVLGQVGGQPVIVHPSGCIIRPADGKILADGLFALTQSSPVVHENLLVIPENGQLSAFEFPSGISEALSVTRRWQTPTSRAQYQIASPVVDGGMIYTVSLGADWQVTDAATGDVVYSERLPLAQRVYASVHLAGNHLFVSNQHGKTAVLEPGDRYGLVGVNEIDFHPTSSIFAGTRQYLRTHKSVYCIGEP